MNNKGFTLVEMLATVVILSIVMGIAIYGAVGAIDKSKQNSEKLFVSKLETVIQTYISLNKLKLNWKSGNTVGSFIKCSRVAENGNCYSDEESQVTNFYEVNGLELYNSSFSISLLADENYIQGGKIINPKNKLNCLDNGKDPSVKLYKDEDSVFYYYVDLSGDNTSCNISDNTDIISNIPEKMCNELSGYTWDNNKEVCTK